MIRLLLVDDHAVVREGYRRLLERRADLTIVGEAASGAEACTLQRELNPDVVIVDLVLPDISGIEVIRRLAQRQANCRMLAFTMHCNPLFASQALKAGALGFVTKSSAPEVLIDAVYKVACNERVLSPDIAPELALTLLDGTGEDLIQGLTSREFEVLRLLVHGCNSEEIGARLHISPKTAHNIHYQIKAKLGARNDFDLMRIALRMKLADVGE
ncbi:MAG TPA: response regulator transcription factor [Paucimonas sp.]|nr:response regulator transcription factor [Paucimonas sp.]